MSFEEDARGVSEGAGIAVLILMTVLVTASVGVSVLFVGAGDDTGVQANFTYEYLSDRTTLLVTHADGDEIQAGDLVIDGPETNVTWAGVAGQNETELVTQGDLIQLSQNSAYGSRVRAADTIRVVYAPDDGNRTVLSTWSDSGGI